MPTARIRNHEADVAWAKAAWCFCIASGLAAAALRLELGIALASIIALAITGVFCAFAVWTSIRAGKDQRRRREARKAYLARMKDQRSRR